MAGAKNKAKDRQSSRHKARYAAQRDVTPVNKAINVARHIVRYGDAKQKDVLRAMPKLTLTHAASKLHKRMVASGAIVRDVGITPRYVLLELAR